MAAVTICVYVTIHEKRDQKCGVCVCLCYVYYVCVHVNILGRMYKTGIILATCEYSSWGSQGKNAEVICHSLSSGPHFVRM